MDRATETRFTLPGIFQEAKVELASIVDGYVEIRIYKSHNALENYDLTTVQRKKGRIGHSAEIAAN